ncbi:MAG: hypothetical protein ACI4TW_01830 [Prevotella sp.]
MEENKCGADEPCLPMHSAEAAVPVQYMEREWIGIADSPYEKGGFAGF